MTAGAARRERKKATKQQATASARAHGAQSAADLLRTAQARRSEVFAFARAGRADLVRKGVWEDNVGAGEVERLDGYVAGEAEKENVDFGGGKGKGKRRQGEKEERDAAETLVLIAAKRGDAELVEWLIDHGATPDERDVDGFTAFHHALLLGCVPLISYYLTSHPPTSDPTSPDASYPPPPEHTLLSLAVTSGRASAVALVVPLATPDDAWDNWCYVEDCQGEKTSGSGGGQDEWEEIKWALVGVEGFTAPPGYQRRPRKR